ncbi:MAG: ABC transporter permease subunit [Nitriliruptorales bacterium]|nr:ABC transporter permease subunit [Nitriliruptorales bacterium]
MSWRVSAAIIRHEFRIMLKDPSTILFILFMPLVMTALMKPLYQSALSARGVSGATGAEQAVPGMAVAFAAFGVGFSGFAFFREHGWGTWERLRASAATSADIMTGKLVPAFSLTLIQMAALLALGVPLFGFAVAGSVLGLAAVVVAVTLALTAFGMTVTAISRTSQQLNALGSLGSMLFGIIGGAFVPVAFMPAWARAIAPATPTYWAMRGFRSVTLDAGGLGSVALPVVVLLGMAALFGAIAAMKFRFEETRIYFG